MRVSISWNPSSRRFSTSKNRLIFAGAKISTPVALRRICTRRSLDGQTQHGPADRDQPTATKITRIKARRAGRIIQPASRLTACKCSESATGESINRVGGVATEVSGGGDSRNLIAQNQPRTAADAARATPLSSAARLAQTSSWSFRAKMCRLAKAGCDQQTPPRWSS